MASTAVPTKKAAAAEPEAEEPQVDPRIAQVADLEQQIQDIMTEEIDYTAKMVERKNALTAQIDDLKYEMLLEAALSDIPPEKRDAALAKMKKEPVDG